MKSKGKLSLSQKQKDKSKISSTPGQAKISSFFGIQPLKHMNSSFSSLKSSVLEELKSAKDDLSLARETVADEDQETNTCIDVSYTENSKKSSYVDASNDSKAITLPNSNVKSQNVPDLKSKFVKSPGQKFIHLVEDDTSIGCVSNNDDSDEDTVCPTPEQVSHKKKKKNFLGSIFSSPDYIPPTPDATIALRHSSAKAKPRLLSFTNSKSKGVVSKNASALNPLDDKEFPRPSACQTYSKKSNSESRRSWDRLINLPASGPDSKNSENNNQGAAVKRPAEYRTGFSPNAKKILEDFTLQDKEPDKSNCKTDLLEKFDFACPQLNSSSESNGSFSLVMPKLLEKSKKSLIAVLSTKCGTSDVFSSAIVGQENEYEIDDPSQKMQSKTAESPPYSSDDKTQDVFVPHEDFLPQSILTLQSPPRLQNNIIDDVEKIETCPSPIKLDSNVPQGACKDVSAMDRPFLSGSHLPTDIVLEEMPELDAVRGTSPPRKVMSEPSLQEKKEAEAITEFMEDDEAFDAAELAFDIEKMSPFKNEKKSTTASEVPLSKFASQVSMDGIDPSSYCATGQFGRHVVLAVFRDPYRAALILNLLALPSKRRTKATLTGMWADAVVKEDDIVHILFCSDVDGEYTLTDTQGVLIINPDLLLSGTSVVAGCYCRRKAVLSERFKGIDRGNQVMLVGSLVHQLFQEVVQQKQVLSTVELERLLQQLVRQAWVVRDLYGLGLTQDKLHTEMRSFLPHIHNWLNKYMASASITGVKRPSTSKDGRGWHGMIENVQDIEENFWSPRFGLKGKIDLTVRVKDARGQRVLPLELKTGRASFSSEHKGQVILYSLMSGDRRQDPRGGLLLYLRDGSMEEVPAGDLESRALLQLRNEMAHYLSRPPQQAQDGSGLELPELPAPIDSERGCGGCPHLLACCALQDRPPPAPHAMARLMPATLGHLSQSALDFFRRWCLLLHLEQSQGRRATTSALWCKDPHTREADGGALCFLRLSVCERRGVGLWLHSFLRAAPEVVPHTLPSTLPTTALKVGDLVVVSTRSSIAVAQGVVHAISTASVTVSLDRDMRGTPSYRTAGYFHLDVCLYQGGMNYGFTGLAHLLQDNERAAALRRLLIDCVPGVVKAGLSRDIVTRGRPVLKPLNLDQQRAVLRCCMGQDYTVIQGYPGTGKSVCVVALVRLLVLLGKTVLLTSYTHSALDNILLKLKPTGVDFLRLGRVSRIHEDLHDHADELLVATMTDVGQLETFYASKSVVASTCLGVNHVIFTKRHFDVCIVDEAAQVSLPACLSPLLLASKFVLVGDSKQLPPLIQSQQARALGAAESVFSALEQHGSSECCASLTLQYRMNGPVLRLANALMYDGKLRCATTAVEAARLHLPHLQRWSPGPSPRWERVAVSPDPSVVLLDTGGAAPEESGPLGLTNKREADLVARIIATLLLLGVSGDDIGVIAPYRAQVRLLADTLAQRVRHHASHRQPDGLTPLLEGELTALCRRVEVNTVDQYQGRDKPVILYSCVRSRSGLEETSVAPHHSEILQDARRINVSITRAKHKLVIVGDARTLAAYEPFGRLLPQIKGEEVVRLGQEEEGGWAGLGL